MGMIELVQNMAATIKRFRAAPGDAVIVKSVGLGGADREDPLYQHHGFRSRPVASTRGVRVSLGSGTREGIVIATENYTVNITLADGETAIYSTDANGAVKAQIILGSDGKIAAKNDAESIATLMADFIDEMTGATTTGSPTTHAMSAATQAALAALKLRFAALLGA